MAKGRKAPEPGGDHVKTSISIARLTHARLSAIASLRGCSMNAIIVEALEEVARGMVLVDKRKSADGGNPPVQVRNRAEAGANLDDPEGEGKARAA